MSGTRENFDNYQPSSLQMTLMMVELKLFDASKDKKRQAEIVKS